SQPVIVLGWSHKYQEVMQLFNLDDLVFDFKQFDSNGIVDTIDLILSDMQITELKLSQQREAVIASSQDQFNYLFSLLDKKQS
ncbi:MAG: hypothetical protein KZQ86_11045, partial [Candidatus Thiodiazotropha sp. (ex Lucinoma kastoroae)]|nr:hypothetical protein [Candidatus Thiodiazotropha sp. (ex Lucinoma kastoroae)]